MLIVALAGCASSYKPDGFSGGYSETQLDLNVFRVSFRGNGYTKADRAEDFAMLRSADITLSKGFKYFTVIDGNTSETQHSYTTPKQSFTNANATAYGNSAYGTATTTTYGGQTFTSSRPTSTNTIMCFNEKPENHYPIYDARFICDSIGNKYNVACQSLALYAPPVIQDLDLNNTAKFREELKNQPSNSTNQDLNSNDTTSECQTSLDCKDGKSCRIKPISGMECR